MTSPLTPSIVRRRERGRFTRHLAAAVAATAVILSVPVSATAQGASRPIPGSVGVLLVAHGGGELWNARVDSLAAAFARSPGVRAAVAVSFLMGDAAAKRPFQAMVDTLARRGATRVVIVPVLVSSHSGHYEQIRWLAGKTDSLDSEMMHHLHMSGVTRSPRGLPMTVAQAMDAAPELAVALASRVRALAPAPQGRAVMLLGHGPNSAEDYAAWMHELRPVADSVRTLTGASSVMVEMVRDDAPPGVRAEAVTRTRELIQLQRAASGHDVLVVPILVSSGAVSDVKLPRDLAGLPIVYNGAPILPDSALVAWVQRRAAEALDR